MKGISASQKVLPAIARRIFIVCAAALSVCCVRAFALDPAKAVGQYVHDEWHSKDGLPDDVIEKVAQTPDGYLWLATAQGLVRFDGARFVTFDRRNTTGLTNFDILTLAVDREGVLWVGTDGGGLAAFHDGRFETYTTANGLTNDTVRAIFADREGALWVGTHGGLLRLQGGRFTAYTTREGLSHDNVRMIAEGPDGDIWVATQVGLDRLHGGAFTNYFKKDGLPDDNVWSVFVDSEGDVWTGTGSDAKSVSRFKDGRFTLFTEKDGFVSNPTMAFCEDRAGNFWVGSAQRFRGGRFLAGIAFGPHVTSTYEDAEGSLWFSTNGRGLHRLKDGKFTTYASGEGLPGDKLGTVHADAQGRVWLALDDGTGTLSRFDGGRFMTLSAKDGLPLSGILAVDVDARGDLWAGSYNMGLARVHGDDVRVYTTRDGLPVDKIVAVVHDAAGDVWVGTNGGGLARFRDGKFDALYTTREGLPSDTLHALLADSRGRVWVGTMSGLSCLEGGKVISYGEAPGLARGAVYALDEGPDGSIFVGTSGGGLSRFRDGRFVTCTTNEGLFNDVIHQLVVDDRGDIWMGHPRGVSRVTAREFEDFAAGHIKRVSTVSYGVDDGMRVAATSDFGTAAKTPDGRLWFPTPQGVAVVNPRVTSTDAPAPRVIIESLAADGGTLNLRADVRLPAGNQRLEFQYTATSFLDPDKLRFRYRLEGFDRDWVEAGARRTASYTNLPPGNYTFRVAACNGDGLCDETGAAFAFEQRPHFYQTAWFYLLCAAALCGVAWGAYRLRVRRMRRRVEARFEAVLEERNRIAREIHDTLAQGFAGISVQLESVDEIFDASPAEARTHLDAARVLARSSLAEARRSIWNLRPVSLGGDDLPAALAKTARQLTAGRDVQAHVEVRGTPRRLAAFVEENLLRVGQESVANAVRHAGARNIYVRLGFGRDTVRLAVRDDGGGFDAKAARPSNACGFGLFIMRERAEKMGGRFALESVPGRGTEITVTVPAE